jgi:hypothetical protein
LLLQRVDGVTDSRSGAPQALCCGREAPRFDHGQQHQKLIDTGRSRIPHFRFLEKNFQFLQTFLDREKS